MEDVVANDLSRCLKNWPDLKNQSENDLIIESN